MKAIMLPRSAKHKFLIYYPYNQTKSLTIISTWSLIRLVKTDDKMTTAELQKIKINDLSQGMDLVAEIDHRRSALLREMQNEGSIPNWSKLQDERFELFKAKKSIQSQMGKLVKANLGKGATQGVAQ